MKKTLLLALAGLVSAHFANAQKTVTVDANDALNSNTKIVAQTSIGQIFFTGHQLGTGYSYPAAGIFRAWTDNPNGATNVFIDGIAGGAVNFSVRADGQGYFAGKVGIGNSMPNATLDVNGNVIMAGSTANLDNRNGGVPLSFLENTGKMMIGWNRTQSAGETDFISNQGGGSVGGFAFYNHSNTGTENQLMWLTGDGRLILGSSASNIGNNKLAVGGGVIAEAVTVKLQANWPDYVFKKDYQLPSLQEVKTYIDQNQHLPEVPSAEQIAKEGLNLGEMNKLLMKKVEELTLYLIDEHKKNKGQQEQIDQLKKEIQLLNKKLK